MRGDKVLAVKRGDGMTSIDDLSPDELTRRLTYAGLVLAGYELVKRMIVGPIKAFYTRSTFGAGMPFKSYDLDVRPLAPNEFEACLLYLKDFMQAITADDLAVIQSLRKHRNDLAHDLVKALPDLRLSDNRELWYNVDQTLFGLSNYRLRMELGADPAFSDADWDTAKGPEYLLFERIVERVRLVLRRLVAQRHPAVSRCFKESPSRGRKLGKGEPFAIAGNWAMTSEKQRFYELSCMGRADEGDAEERWSGTLRLDHLVESSMTDGKILEEWTTTRLEMDSKGPAEDMPWAGRYCHIVSTRLRDLIEKHAPHHAQFLPLRTTYKGEELPGSRYWAVVWLHVIDCFDRGRSKFHEVKRPRDTILSFDRLVIDTAAVPEHVLVCRVKYDVVTTIIRKELRKILDANKITGCQYYDLHQI